MYKLFYKGASNVNININTNKTNIVSQNVYEVINDLMENINIVLESIIPSFKLGIKKKCKASIHDYEMNVEFEFISIRGNEELPLKYEAEGTKRIVSILGVMIAVYNDPQVCLVIDELDSGMFEFLFGEILTIFKENAKGQFIFTANNLRALEILNKNSIVFTTTNPKNKYIRFKGVKTTNNLRNLYLRSISEESQEESLYKLTSREKIDKQFRVSWSREYCNIIKNNYE